MAPVLGIALVSCQSVPDDVLKLSPESLKQRQLQTRRYTGISEPDLLVAGAGVLQDLGFTIQESETRLGLIVGSKDRNAVDPTQVVSAFFLAMFGGQFTIEKNQQIRVSLVVRSASEKLEDRLVRVTFQRVVWDTNSRVTRRETLERPEFYQGFFQMLSKAVFLEGQKI